VSATGITGFPIAGNNADRIGTTNEVIGSAEFPFDRLIKNCGAVKRAAILLGQVEGDAARADFIQFFTNSRRASPAASF
jgi:hypothetical protein